MKNLLCQVRACHLCPDLPLGPKPLLKLDSAVRLLIVGQAPGRLAHERGIPWDDPSGNTLRHWLGIDRRRFYEDPRLGILPMGLCYPGSGSAGDLAPRAICAPTWHPQLLKQVPKLELTLLLGQYAQRYYLPDLAKASLTERVAKWQSLLPSGFLPLAHPSPRNRHWLKNNPWFEIELLPALRERVAQLLSD